MKKLTIPFLDIVKWSEHVFHQSLELLSLLVA